MRIPSTQSMVFLALNDGKHIICFNDKAVRHFWA